MRASWAKRGWGKYKPSSLSGSLFVSVFLATLLSWVILISTVRLWTPFREFFDFRSGRLFVSPAMAHCVADSHVCRDQWGEDLWKVENKFFSSFLTGFLAHTNRSFQKTFNFQVDLERWITVASLTAHVFMQLKKNCFNKRIFSCPGSFVPSLGGGWVVTHHHQH